LSKEGSEADATTSGGQANDEASTETGDPVPPPIINETAEMNPGEEDPNGKNELTRAQKTRPLDEGADHRQSDPPPGRVEPSEPQAVPDHNEPEPEENQKKGPPWKKDGSLGAWMGRKFDESGATAFRIVGTSFMAFFASQWGDSGVSQTGKFGWILEGLPEIMSLVGVGLYAVGEFWNNAQHKELLALRESLDEANDEREALRVRLLQESMDYFDLVRSILKLWFEPQLAQDERVSVYKNDKPNGFVLIGRFSARPNLQYRSRNLYRMDGIIAKAWNEGSFFKNDFPDFATKQQNYIQAQMKTGVDRETVLGFKMKSRSYFAHRLNDRRGDPIAVIVFEGLRQKCFTKKEAESRLDGLHRRLAVFIEYAKAREPRPGTAREEGF